MVGLIQIVIYLLAVYLIYKGVEIFQVAYMAPLTHKPRQNGIVVGIAAICIGGAIAILAIFAADGMAVKIGNTLNR